MIKASAGGGGKGMRIAWNDEETRYCIPGSVRNIRIADIFCNYTVCFSCLALMTINSFSSNLARYQGAFRLCSLNMAGSGGGQSLKCEGPVQRITRNVRQS